MVEFWGSMARTQFHGFFPLTKAVFLLLGCARLGHWNGADVLTWNDSQRTQNDFRDMGYQWSTTNCWVCMGLCDNAHQSLFSLQSPPPVPAGKWGHASFILYAPPTDTQVSQRVPLCRLHARQSSEVTCLSVLRTL